MWLEGSFRRLVVPLRIGELGHKEDRFLFDQQAESNLPKTSIQSAKSILHLPVGEVALST